MKHLYTISFIVIFTTLAFPVFTFSQSANPNDPNDFQYVFIDAGGNHTVALKCDGTVRCWGDNSSGQLGNNNGTTDSNVPVQVVSSSGSGELTGIIAVDAGRNFTLALRDDSTIWAWGNNSVGQLGDNQVSGTSSAVPVQVSGITTAVAIVAGSDHSLVILADGTVVSWGDDNKGKLGCAGCGQQLMPVSVQGLDANAIAVAANGNHSMVLQADGTVKTCGGDFFGQLGDSQSSDPRNTLVYVVDQADNTLTNVIGIAAGSEHSLAVLNNGEVYSWGEKGEGELGRSCTTPLCKVAGQVGGITNAVALGAGSNYSFAMLADSTLVGWGRNIEGQLGLGDNTNKSAPTAVTTLTNRVLAVAAGTGPAGGGGEGHHTIAMMETDSLKTWGLNDQGQLGNSNTGTDANTPVTVVGYDLGTLVAEAGNDTAMCSGDTVQIGETGDYTRFQYSWTPSTYLFGPGTTQPDTLSDPQVTAVVTQTVTMQYIVTKLARNGGGVGVCVVQDTVYVTINAGTVADFTTSTPPGCVDKEVNFYNAGTSGGGRIFLWNFGTDATPATDTTEFPPTVVYSTAGAKTVTLSVVDPLCGSGDFISKLITINDNPTVSLITTAPSCVGEAVDFFNGGTSGAGVSFLWDFGAGADPATSTVEDPTGVVYGTAGTKVITLTIDDGNCSFTDTIIRNINVAPTASFSSTAPTCTGDTVDFTNTGSTGGSWTYSWNFGSGASPDTSTTENPTGIIYSTSGTKSITLTVSDGTCSDSVTQTININQQPTASFNSTAPDCGNAGIDFTNTGSTGGTWSYNWDFGNAASPASSTAENPLGVMYSTSGTKTVTLTVTDGICVSSASQSIGINSTPTASFASTAPSCELDSVDFTNIGSTGGIWTYSWNFGSGATPGTDTAENPVDVIYSSFGTKSIMLVITDGACSDTAVQTINIFDRPSVGFNSTAPVCAGLGVNFVNSGSSGSNWSYSWDFGLGAFPSESGAEDPVGIVYSAGGDKTVTLTISDGNCTESFTGIIFIDTLPAAAAGPDTVICANRSVQIGSSSVTGNSYSWFPTPTLDSAFIANPTASPEATFTVYHVTVTGANSCKNSDTVNVTMLLPLSADAGIDVEICAGDSVQIGAALIEGQFYSWSPSNGLSNTASPNPIAGPSSTTVYALTVSDDYNCDPITDQVEVLVHPLPSAEAGSDTSIARGESIQLIATGGVDYVWSPDYELSNTGIDNPIASPDSTTTYYVQVTDVYGCVSTDSITITVVEPEIWLPDAFTPNGDGQNDKLYVRGIIPEELKNFEFSVYDRLGQRVFHTKDGMSGWDGANMASGEDLRGGAYVYVVTGSKTDGTAIDMKGLVNLVK